MFDMTASVRSAGAMIELASQKFREINFYLLKLKINDTL